jgi:hypothetical protein
VKSDIFKQITIVLEAAAELAIRRIRCCCTSETMEMKGAWRASLLHGNLLFK